MAAVIVGQRFSADYMTGLYRSTTLVTNGFVPERWFPVNRDDRLPKTVIGMGKS